MHGAVGCMNGVWRVCARRVWVPCRTPTVTHSGQASECDGRPRVGACPLAADGGARARADGADAGVASAAAVGDRCRGSMTSHAAAGAAGAAGAEAAEGAAGAEGAEGTAPSLRSSAGAGEEVHTSHKRLRQAPMAGPTVVVPSTRAPPSTMATDANAGSFAAPMSGGLPGLRLRPPWAPQPPQPQPPQPPQPQPQPSNSCSISLGSSSWTAAALTPERPTGSLNLWQPQPPPPPPLLASVTPSQQALHVACLCLQREHTDAEACQVARALAVSLGASRVESGTIKALHAIVLQLVCPGMSDTEAYTSTAASCSNFFKWRRLVRDAQLRVDHLCQSTCRPPA